MKIIQIFMGLVSFVGVAHAEEGGSSSVVDLGQLSVTGEVRRPAISWIDSQKSVREMVPSLVKSEYDAYESELLEPKKIESNVINESKDKYERN